MWLQSCFVMARKFGHSGKAPIEVHKASATHVHMNNNIYTIIVSNKNLLLHTLLDRVKLIMHIA